MAYPIQIKEKAVTLRKKGCSYNEINRKLRISKGTLSKWLSEIHLSKKARMILENKQIKGSMIAGENKKRKTKLLIQEYLKEGNKTVNHANFNNDTLQVICALLYWCEGIKRSSTLMFTNSDPELVRTFLRLLRKTLDIDETKFRVCVHLHSYHNASKEQKFWSDITNIPLNQFTKPYQKKHGGKRVRKGYNGCASIRYHDVVLHRKLLTTSEAFFKKMGA